MQSRNIVIGILSILLVVVLIYTFVINPETDGTPIQAQISQQTQEIEQLKQTNDQLQQQVDQQQVDQQRAVRSSENRIASLQEELEQKLQIQKSLTKKDTGLAETPSSSLKKQEMEVTERSDKSVVIRFSDTVLFDVGKVHLKPSGKKLLRKVGAVLSQIKELDIQVEGHTDNIPIARVLQRKYATNWELSAARSTNVVRYLVENLGVDGAHISAAGYGQYRPVADNNTFENQRLNRRVEFVLRPILPEVREALPDLN